MLSSLYLVSLLFACLLSLHLLVLFTLVYQEVCGVYFSSYYLAIRICGQFCTQWITLKYKRREGLKFVVFPCSSPTNRLGWTICAYLYKYSFRAKCPTCAQQLKETVERKYSATNIRIQQIDRHMKNKNDKYTQNKPRSKDSTTGVYESGGTKCTVILCKHARK